MRRHVIDNSRKELNHGKTLPPSAWASRTRMTFCTTTRPLNFRPVNYTNNPTVLARQSNMRQSTALSKSTFPVRPPPSPLESVLQRHRRQADFMRGAVLSPGGKTILAIQSTAENDEDLAHCPLSQGRRGRDALARRHPLRGDRIRHCLPARQEYPRTRHGPDLDRAPEIPLIGSSRKPRPEPYLRGPGLHTGLGGEYPSPSRHSRIRERA